MQIVSYNVAGLRAHIKKPEFHMFINANTSVGDSFVGKFDIICLQETKAEEKQVVLPEAAILSADVLSLQVSKVTQQKQKTLCLGSTGTLEVIAVFYWLSTKTLQNTETNHPVSVSAPANLRPKFCQQN